MRVLGVVLYVALLLSCLASAYGACNGNGRLAGSKCICNSGYEGANCDNVIPDTCISKEVSATTATDFPVLDKSETATTFSSNHLKASIIAPFVANRTFTELKFTDMWNNDTRCSIDDANSFWKKSGNCSNGDATDRFSLDLPWIFHRGCGFLPNAVKTNSSVLVITGRLAIKYTDVLETIEDFPLLRTVSVPYTMSVTFQKNIEVQLLALNITSDVHFGVALTGDEYDPELQLLTLELTTIINYPNIFHPRYAEFSHPAHVVVSPRYWSIGNQMKDVVPSSIGSNSTCLLDKGVCTQKWTIVIMLNSTYEQPADSQVKTNCSFDGEYKIRHRLYTCRGSSSDEELDCTFTYSWVNFTIATSDVCGRIDVTPHVEGKLLAFPSALFPYESLPNSKHLAVTSFRLGTEAKFYADIESDGNDITLSFTDIKFAVKPAGAAEPEWKYLHKNNQSTGADIVPHAVNIKLDINDHAKAFRIYFHSSVFQVMPDQSVTYIISANATIVFEGNGNDRKKRTVEYTYETSAMESSTKVGVVGPKSVTQSVQPPKLVEETGPSPVVFAASVIGAVAGTLIIVFVVVGFALRTRSQVQKRDEAASPAVSAANAAAATVEVAVNRA